MNAKQRRLQGCPRPGSCVGLDDNPPRVAPALEERAKEIDEEAGPHRMMTAEAQSFRDGLLMAADIVRGKS